jgi:hypothetical protein
MTKKRKSQGKEIIYHIVNSLLAGGLVLLGSFTTGAGITSKGLLFASIAAAIVCVTRFKEYWDGEADEYSTKLFKFL